MTDISETPIQGGCLCGEVAFEVTPPAKFCSHCHCTMCRRAHGAPFVTWVGMPEAQVRVVKGQGTLMRYRSSPGGSRSFCGKCGTQLFCQNDHAPGLIDVTRASMPDDAGFDWWLNQIAVGNHELNTMAAGFIFSEEFIGFFDAPDGNSIDNDEFVNHMYVNVFGREPDQGGFDFWFGELELGSRTQVDVLVEMTQSNEYVQLTVYSAVDYLIG